MTATDANSDPYYGESRVRFELRDEDVLLTPGDGRVEPAECGSVLVSERAGARVTVCGLRVDEARDALAAVDGRRSARDAREAARLGDDTWARFIEGTFGILVFAPYAVADLETRASGVEIVRFPGSPYEIVRSYWANMGALAARLEDLDGALRSTATFVEFLRELNAIALTGLDGNSSYRPANALVAKEGVSPGELLQTPPLTAETPNGTRFVSGPRVNATLIGGASYQSLLALSIGDAGALDARRAILDPSGLSWGSVVMARADRDEAEAPWFCPPRPFDDRHFETLRAHLQAAQPAPGEVTVRELGAFHWSFVRLHPFSSANQCVAMSIVNHVLRRTKGAGVPHLILDHLALRFSKDAAARLLERAVRAWLVRGESPAERTLELIARKRRAFAVLEAISRAASLEEAEEIARSRSEDAKLVMLEW